MANVVEIIFTSKDLTGKGFAKLNKGFSRISAGVAGVSRRLFSLKGLIAGAGIGLLAKSFIDASNTTDQLQVRLSVLLGSVEEGNRLFKDMSTFAGEVPFEYEEIMNSATMLSGILKGGVDEIKEWMPLIGDLAATAGLSIQKTTEQVSRMLSAGAASADLFRERGITAMLGFTAGVQVSAEETRKRLMAAWDDPLSKFKGATELLKSTWGGIISMINDKWFQLRNIIMDAGLMDFVKAIAMTIDQFFGDAIEASKTQAVDWANTVINGIRSILSAVEFLVNAFHGVRVAWATLEVAFSVGAGAILDTIYSIVDGWRLLADLIPGINLGPMQVFKDLVESVHARTKLLTDELQTLAMEPMPGDNVKAFADAIESNFERIRATIEKTKTMLKGEKGGFFDWDAFLDTEETALQKSNAILAEYFLTEKEAYTIDYEEKLLALENYYMSSEMTDEEHRRNKEQLEAEHQANLGDEQAKGWKARMAFDGLAWKQKVSMFTQMGDQLMNAAKGQNKTLWRIGKALAVSEAIINTIRGINQALGAYPPPWSFVMAALVGAVGFLNVRKIKAQQYSQAHSGITSVTKDATFEVQAGERIIRRDQNRDLTDYLDKQEKVTEQNNVTNETQNRGVVIENLYMNFDMPAESLRDIDDTELQEIIAAKWIPALDALSDQGTRQKDFTFGEQR